MRPGYAVVTKNRKKCKEWAPSENAINYQLHDHFTYILKYNNHEITTISIFKIISRTPDSLDLEMSDGDQIMVADSEFACVDCRRLEIKNLHFQDAESSSAPIVLQVIFDV